MKHLRFSINIIKKNDNHFFDINEINERLDNDVYVDRIRLLDSKSNKYEFECYKRFDLDKWFFAANDQIVKEYATYHAEEIELKRGRHVIENSLNEMNIVY